MTKFNITQQVTCNSVSVNYILQSESPVHHLAGNDVNADEEVAFNIFKQDDEVEAEKENSEPKL